MSSSDLTPIAITIGEPAGIGPELIVKLLQTLWPTPLVIIGNHTLLERTAHTLNLPFKKLPPYVKGEMAATSIIDLPLAANVVAGELDVLNAPFVIAMLERAALGALNKEFAAIVTGPVHKGILNEAGCPFSGHTEFFAAQSHIEKPVMVLMNDKIKLALITTHLPLKHVSDHITEKNIRDVLLILHKSLQTQFLISNPRIGVCALNPHAGEGGHLGMEEIDVIIPCLNQLRATGMNLIGPLSADTAFLPDQLPKYDAMVAMYHDQGLPVIKQMDFAKTVNITLGLPFIRTSVDHGTALDIAGKGIADVRNFQSALGAAIILASPLEESIEG
jgi:4-hydroxythreonine-4-phosphate dehydrogenase